jgi:hypothetical protein
MSHISRLPAQAHDIAYTTGTGGLDRVGWSKRDATLPMPSPAMAPCQTLQCPAAMYPCAHRNAHPVHMHDRLGANIARLQVQRFKGPYPIWQGGVLLFFPSWCGSIWMSSSQGLHSPVRFSRKAVSLLGWCIYGGYILPPLVRYPTPLYGQGHRPVNACNSRLSAFHTAACATCLQSINWVTVSQGCMSVKDINVQQTSMQAFSAWNGCPDMHKSPLLYN